MAAPNQKITDLFYPGIIIFGVDDFIEIILNIFPGGSLLRFLLKTGKNLLDRLKGPWSIIDLLRAETIIGPALRNDVRKMTCLCVAYVWNDGFKEVIPRINRVLLFPESAEILMRPRICIGMKGQAYRVGVPTLEGFLEDRFCVF